MSRSFLITAWLFALLSILVANPVPVSAQGNGSTLTPPVTEGISLPLEGAALMGVVNIEGTTRSDWSLDFTYRDDPTGTWFNIKRSSSPVPSGLLASWDTASISDGFYVVRLRFDEDGVPREFKINVHIGNSVLPETGTPTFAVTILAISTPPVTATELPTLEAPATETQMPPLFSTPLPALPPNPAALSTQDILITVGKSILAVLVVFALTGLLLSMRPK